MYSYEERIRAVKLYIKFGNRLGATIRQLGYPTKYLLIDWYREYERDRYRSKAADQSFIPNYWFGAHRSPISAPASGLFRG